MADVNLFVKENFSEVSKSLRKESRSVRNRIFSIITDSKFVAQVSEAYNLPLVANERCGRWYITPKDIFQSVYFKSTNGHTGQWSFSLRRLNFHILDPIAKNNGVIIVDSTRRGKRMPDALSKTIPIWCAVLNKAVFNIDYFFTPPNAVFESEHKQIEEKIEEWSNQFKALIGENEFTIIKSSISKPIRPIWITPDSYLPNEPPEFDTFIPIVLCTASRMVQDGSEFHPNGFYYVQGAADDHEEWCQSLTPEILWENRAQLMACTSDEEIQQIVLHMAQKYDDAKRVNYNELDITNITNTNIWIGKTHRTLPGDLCDVIISLREKETNEDKNSLIIQPLSPGKKGSKDLRVHLPNLIARYDKLHNPEKRVLITCDSGNDFSVGVATVILSLYYTSDFKCLPKKQKSSYNDKDQIRKRLAKIITSRKCNPSRATLNSVNSFLMG